jgi:hypothetical protein
LSSPRTKTHASPLSRCYAGNLDGEADRSVP